MLETLVMVTHEKHQFWPGHIIAESGSQYKVKLFNDEGEVDVPSNQVFPIGPACLESTDDMTKLEQLHDSIILHILRNRWKENIIYTYIGPMIISINPHQNIDRPRRSRTAFIFDGAKSIQKFTRFRAITIYHYIW